MVEYTDNDGEDSIWQQNHKGLSSTIITSMDSRSRLSGCGVTGDGEVHLAALEELHPQLLPVPLLVVTFLNTIPIALFL